MQSATGFVHQSRLRQVIPALENMSVHVVLEECFGQAWVGSQRLTTPSRQMSLADVRHGKVVGSIKRARSQTTEVCSNEYKQYGQMAGDDVAKVETNRLSNFDFETWLQWAVFSKRE